MLPDGWTIRRLEDLATVERGKFSARPRNDPKFFGGDIPFVQTGDVTNSSIYVRNYSQTLNKEGLSVSKIFPKGTILMTIAANIGDTAIASFDLACPDSLVGIIVKKNKADAYWLRIFLGTQKTTLENYAPQNAQKNINLQTLKPLEILTPPLPEQKKIAAILSTWDRAIEGTETLLANSRQQKKALMQQLLTGKKRLPGFTGEWFHLPFKKVAELIYGKALPEKPSAHTTVYPVYGTGGIISYRDEYLFEGPSIIIGRKGTIDTPRYVNTPFWCIDTTFYCKSIHNNDVKFLYYSTCFVKLRRYVEASGVPSLSRDTIYSIPLMLPPLLSEQKAIAAVLTTADEEITTLESDLSRLRQEKKALMQQLLTGKRRVTVD
ncbi:restriction endonuclease subunit S [Brytella acorum]|uniref:restriction endonuclease subunit S n=1 Tax=Brytella acorum TaxID=2959299 RepID=UPI0025ADA361|nr:restriction endonuclease subunit S [Brytella acorum]MDF3626156.1 restriction endonuclease subunit S [Brytella acorum]